MCVCVVSCRGQRLDLRCCGTIRPELLSCIITYLSTGFQFDAKRAKNMDLNVSFDLPVNVGGSATVTSR